MARITTTVSIEAEKEYVAALATLARQQGVTVGRLVKDATDSKYADQLEPLQAIFSASSVASKQQSDDTSNNKEATNAR